MPTRLSGQGWFINTRREKFKDSRLREAIINAFDFEWTNRNLFYGSYTRQFSFFQISDFMAVGPPSPEEIALLEPFRADLPEAAFGDPYVPPQTAGSPPKRWSGQATSCGGRASWNQLSSA